VRALRRGESLVLTLRGKPLGRIVPYEAQGAPEAEIRPIETAWQDIEATLRSTRPRYATWRLAEDTARGRR
jgi:antitoxin (DNA-binding transcriptional repressor) of toxin-antitoxin stability system